MRKTILLGTDADPRLAPLALVLLLAFPASAQNAANKASDQTAANAAMSHTMPNASFTLTTGIAQGKMVFIGKGGAIDGKVNPTLTVHEGDTVQITLINGEGAEHDISLPDVRASSQRVVGRGASSALVFRASNIGAIPYFCTVPGHRESGMEGVLRVEPAQPQGPQSGVVSISRDPTDLPHPGRRAWTRYRSLRAGIDRARRAAQQRLDVRFLDL